MQQKVIFIILTLGFLFTNVSDAAKKNKYRKASGEARSSLSQKIAPPGEKLFVFNPRSVSWAAYDASGNLVRSGVANGGSHYCPDVGRRCHTPVGNFRIQSKGPYSCKSSRYPIKRNGTRGGAHMPYCMFFTKNFAIHGYGHLGRSNVSHGCVRVSTSAAQWLSSSFLNIGTRVKVLPY